MRVYQMTIHRRRPTPKIPGVVITAYYGDTDDWEAMLRSFKSTQIDLDPVLRRQMHEIEKHEYERSCRIMWITYSSWAALIRCEFRITQDRSWCERIYALSGLAKSLDDILSDV